MQQILKKLEEINKTPYFKSKLNKKKSIFQAILLSQTI